MYLWNLERKIKLLSPSLLILKIVRGSQFDYNYSYSTNDIIKRYQFVFLNLQTVYALWLSTGDVIKWFLTETEY